MHGHSNIFAVRENCASVSPALLDEAEDVVPAKNRYLGTFIYMTSCRTYRPQLRPEECSRSSNKISSIWNAAGRVSMRTVARIVFS